MKETSTTSLNNLIGCIFKHLRNERSVDQDFVALRLGLSVSTISKIELGNVSITVESIYRLCELFGIRMVDFFIYLDKAQEFLTLVGVKVYVDKSLKVKGVDRRVVSYEVEKKYEHMADIILPPTAVELEPLNAMLGEMFEGMTEEALNELNDSKEHKKSNGTAIATKEAKEHNTSDNYELPILHIKQLYIILEEFFEENQMPLHPVLREHFKDEYIKRKEKKTEHRES